MVDGSRPAALSGPPSIGGNSNAASISTPPALLYLTNSGAATGREFHFWLSVEMTRTGAFGAFTHNSGARVTVSPTNTTVLDDVRTNGEGLTSMPSMAVVLPRRSTMVMTLLKPRAVLTASDWSSIHRGCATARSSVAAVMFC